MSDLDIADTGAVVAPEITEAKPAEEENQEIKQESTPVEDDAEKVKTGFQKRINELTFKQRQAERERDQAIAEAQELKRQATAPQNPENLKVPTLSECNYDENVYASRMADYTRKVAAHEVYSYSEGQQQNQRQQQEQSRFDELIQQHVGREEAFIQSTPDYRQAIDSLAQVVQFTPELGEVIGSSDKSPDILYYLANHVDEADKLSRLPIHLAAAQVGRIEARLSVQKQKPISSTPAPPNTLAGGKAGAPSLRSDMSYAEYKAYRQKTS